MATLPVVRGFSYRNGRLSYVFETPFRANPKDNEKPGDRSSSDKVPQRRGGNLSTELQSVLSTTLRKVSPDRGKYAKHPALNKESLRSRPDYEDLIGAAALAILEAANKYAMTGQPDEAASFERVLDSAARNGINRFLAEKSETVRQGRDVISARKAIAAAEAQIRQRGATGKISASDIARTLRISLDEAQELQAQAASGRTTSLDIQVGDESDGDDGTRVQDLLAAEGSLQDVRAEARQQLSADELNAVDRKFLAWMKLGKYTIEQIGKKMGMGRTMSYDTARRIERLIGGKTGRKR